MLDKRDFREETLLNTAEYALLKAVADELGLSKSATLRYCLHAVGRELIKKGLLDDTGEDE